MKWNDQILTSADIEQIYLDLINEYGAKLPQQEKQIAKDLFIKLHDLGRSWEWIYWAVWQLGERKVINNKGLFYYAEYQKEVDDITKYAKEYHFSKLTMEQFMEDYIQFLVLFEEGNIEKELFERLCHFDNKYWNTEEEFTQEEMEELIGMYKDMIKDQLRVSRTQYEQEQRSIAKEMRRVYGRIIDAVPHPYVDTSLYWGVFE